MADQHTYWGRVHRAALRKAGKAVFGSPGGALLALASLAVAIWGLSVFGSKDAAWDEIVLRAGLGFAGLLALPLLYIYWMKRIPEEWDQIKSDQIKELRETIRPRLEFVLNDECVKNTPVDLGTSRNVRLRIALRNISAAKTIDDVELQLVWIKDSVRQRNIMKPLGDRFGENHKYSLNSGVTIYFNLVTLCLYAAETKKEPNVSVGPLETETIMGVHRGPYKILLSANGRDVSQINSFLFFYVSEDGEIHYRPWQESDNLNRGSLSI